jgi:hypothetical protein
MNIVDSCPTSGQQLAAYPQGPFMRKPGSKHWLAATLQPANSDSQGHKYSDSFFRNRTKVVLWHDFVILLV